MISEKKPKAKARCFGLNENGKIECLYRCVGILNNNFGIPYSLNFLLLNSIIILFIIHLYKNIVVLAPLIIEFTKPIFL